MPIIGSSIPLLDILGRCICAPDFVDRRGDRCSNCYSHVIKLFCAPLISGSTALTVIRSSAVCAGYESVELRVAPSRVYSPDALGDGCRAKAETSALLCDPDHLLQQYRSGHLRGTKRSCGPFHRCPPRFSLYQPKSAPFTGVALPPPDNGRAHCCRYPGVHATQGTTFA